MKPTVTYPDAEVEVADLLVTLLADQDVTVGVALPDDWNVDDSPPHVQAACDGTPSMTHPIVAHAMVRIVVWGRSASEVKALAMRAQGLLCAHAGSETIARIGALTGMLPSRDPDRRAELASVVVRVSLRSVPIV